jgi:hypothetical protein
MNDHHSHWNEPTLTRPPSWQEKIRTAVEETVGPEDIRKADSQSTKMALALAAMGKHVYEGTVSPAVKARRRRRNKAARLARRAVR